jgi:hypothetical protein
VPFIKTSSGSENKPVCKAGLRVCGYFSGQEQPLASRGGGGQQGQLLPCPVTCYGVGGVTGGMVAPVALGSHCPRSKRNMMVFLRCLQPPTTTSAFWRSVIAPIRPQMYDCASHSPLATCHMPLTDIVALLTCFS